MNPHIHKLITMRKVKVKRKNPCAKQKKKKKKEEAQHRYQTSFIYT